LSKFESEKDKTQTLYDQPTPDHQAMVVVLQPNSCYVTRAAQQGKYLGPGELVPSKDGKMLHVANGDVKFNEQQISDLAEFGCHCSQRQAGLPKHPKDKPNSAIIVHIDSKSDFDTAVLNTTGFGLIELFSNHCPACGLLLQPSHPWLIGFTDSLKYVINEMEIGYFNVRRMLRTFKIPVNGYGLN